MKKENILIKENRNLHVRLLYMVHSKYSPEILSGGVDEKINFNNSEYEEN